MDLDYVVYNIIAPMTFLILAKHSPGIRVQSAFDLDPRKYIAHQLDIMLHGMSAKSRASMNARYGAQA